jgi:protein NUD1
MAHQPAWQTEELKDEWPEEGDGVSEHYTRSISLTIPVGSLHSPVHSGTGLSQDTDSDVADVVGTFLIRQDALPALPHRPPTQRKGLIKDFFSPISLERMFDPPSPSTPVFPNSNPSARNNHTRPLQLSTAQTSPVTSLIGGQEGLVNRHPTGTNSLRPDNSRPFTFSVPHPVPLTPIASACLDQNKNATTAVAPLTDPPLRLFQFQYDTFTRDHLSAMVDSIAINSPSGSNTGNFVANTSSPFGLPPVSEASAQSSSIELRSAKRVKLSPASDFHGLKNCTSRHVRRPICRKDYVGESRFLMTQIKSAKHSMSTPPSVSSIPYPSSNDNPPRQSEAQDQSKLNPSAFSISTDLWEVVLSLSNIDSPGDCKESAVAGPVSSFKTKGHSSLGYRRQAESLMAQLKQDMKGSKRIFSTDATDLSPDDASRSSRSIAISSPPYRAFQNQRDLTPNIQRGDSRKLSTMVALS